MAVLAAVAHDVARLRRVVVGPGGEQVGPPAAVDAGDDGLGGHAGTFWLVRVVAGTARGRLLRAPPGRPTRPTSDRVREAMFSMLTSMDAVEGAAVLDLFAGQRGPRHRGPVARRGSRPSSSTTTGPPWPPSGPTWRCWGDGGRPGHGRPRRRRALRRRRPAGGPGPGRSALPLRRLGRPAGRAGRAGRDCSWPRPVATWEPGPRVGDCEGEALRRYRGDGRAARSPDRGRYCVKKVRA